MKTRKRDIVQFITLFLLFWTALMLPARTYAKLSEPDVVHFSGKIVGEKNETLAYALLTVENSNISTISNTDGEFLIKIPKDLLNSRLNISFLGYKKRAIPISELQSEENRLQLQAEHLLLPVLEVAKKDPEFIIRKMLQNIEINYSKKDKLMTAFYRETIRKRNTNVSLSEAIVEVYKRGVTGNLQDMASLYKSRKSTDYNRLDTIVFKLMGGPFNNIYLDISRNPELIFTDAPELYYDFQLKTTDIIDGHAVYVIDFRQYPHVSEPLYEGLLYIDIESYALVRAEFALNLTDNAAATRNFVRRKPLNTRVSTTHARYLIEYRQMDDLWYYAYSRVELGLKISWKKRLFNTQYNTSIEMAATNWDDDVNRQDFRSKKRISPTVIIQDQVSGFSDTDFWGEYNIIEPDKSIENAINKIIKQLEKEK